MTKTPRVALDLEPYPQLKKAYLSNPERFAYFLRGALKHMEKVLETERDLISPKVYKLPYLEMMEQVMDTFFEPEGIADHHYNKHEKKGLKSLGYDLHPLAIFTDNASVYNAEGERVTPREWIDLQDDDFSLKNWLYKLFYGARFVSWGELSEYLSLGKYELVEALKLANYEHLARLQPALDFQQQYNIPVGKLIPGTGILDGGDELTKHHDQCPACGNDFNTTHDKYGYCNQCGIGGLK